MRSLLLLGLVGLGAAAWAQPLDTSRAHEVVHVPPSVVPRLGPPFAEVTLEVYVAIGHSPSLRALELAQRLATREEDVRLLVSVVAIGGEGQWLAAEAAREAAVQERFWPFLERLAAEGHGVPVQSDLLRVGRAAGLDEERLAEALAERRHQEAVHELAEETRGRGRSPGEIWVNGRRVTGLRDESLQAAVREGRQRARALRESGVPVGRLFEALEAEVASESARPTRPGHAPRRYRVPGGTSPTRGPLLAPVTALVFTNFGCSRCLDVARAARRLADAHPGQVRVVWKHWVPVYASRGPEVVACELAALAHLEGRFWALHDRVLATPVGRVPSTADLQTAARAEGIGGGALERYPMEAARTAVERDRLELNAAGLRRGPALYLNGREASSLRAVDVERLFAEEAERGLLDRLVEGAGRVR